MINMEYKDLNEFVPGTNPWGLAVVLGPVLLVIILKLLGVVT